jgi:hypothetical protein
VAVVVVVVLSATLLAACGAAPSNAPKVIPRAQPRNFLPATYRVTSETRVDLDDTDIPEEAVTAIGPVSKITGYAPSTVLLLAWSQNQTRWMTVFNAMKQSSYQTTPQIGPSGPGFVAVGATGPYVATVHDQYSGKSDLVYWVNSVKGNSDELLVGVVHFDHEIASLNYTFEGNYGHAFTFDEVSTMKTGVQIVGTGRRQRVEISLPLLTPVDSESQAARMYSFVIAPRPRNFASYRVVYDSRPFVGVALNSSARVEVVDPGSPAAGKLKVGDVLRAVQGSRLRARDSSSLLGPDIVEQVALLRPAQNVGLIVNRVGRLLVVEVTLAQWDRFSTFSLRFRSRDFVT